LFRGILIGPLDGLEENRHAPAHLLIIVGRILVDEIGARTEKRLAMQRHGVREIPNHGARFGIAPRMTTMILHDDTLNASRQIGFPVLAFGSFFLLIGQLVPPPKFF